MKMSINFYRNRETDQLFVIERNWKGDVISSCGPLKDPLQKIDTYELTTERNAEIQADNDKLELVVVATDYKIGTE